MKILKLFLLILLVVTNSSCSLIYEKIKLSIAPSIKKEKNKNDDRLLSCKITKKNSLSYASENHKLSPLAEGLINNAKFTFVERVALLIIVHAYYRPDVIGPHSNVQLLITSKKRTRYIDLNIIEQKANSFELFETLNYLLRTYSSPRTLNQLIQEVDKLNGKFKVSASLNQFLEENIQSLKSSEELKKLYMKGHQVLQTGESVPELSLLRIFREYQKSSSLRNSQKSSELISLNQDKESVKCNFNSQLHKEKKFSIYPNPMKTSLALSLQDTKGNSALINVNQEVSKPLKVIENSGHFQINRSSQSAAFCQINNREDSLVLLSNKGRDPTQIIFQILQSLKTDDLQQDTQKILSKARFLKLYFPERVVIESHRDEENELLRNEDFKSIPIYHARKLGLIWIQGNSKKSPTISIDDRWPGVISCPN